MGKRLVSIILGAALVAGIAVVGSAEAAKSKRTKFHFTDTVIGAQISPTEAIFKVHDSRLGDGAGVQKVKLTGFSGTDTDITYYGKASAKSHGSFTLSAPDANGISIVTGKGRDTSGTGKLKGFRSRYTLTGTFNLHTLVYRIVLKGTGSTK